MQLLPTQLTGQLETLSLQYLAASKQTLDAHTLAIEELAPHSLFLQGEAFTAKKDITVNCLCDVLIQTWGTCCLLLCILQHCAAVLWQKGGGSVQRVHSFV